MSCVETAMEEVVSGWCQSCEDLKQEVEKLKAEHALNYKALKEKIISTDKLIKRYTAKCQEHDSQTKKLEETTEVLQNYKNDCESFETQLKEALEELGPMKQKNQKYEKLCSQLEKKLEKSGVKLEAAETAQKQYSLAKQEIEKSYEQVKEEKGRLEKRLKELEALTKKNEAAMKKMQDDNDSKKKELATTRKESASWKTRAGKFKMKSECFTELLRSHGLLREGRQMYSHWRRERNSTFKLNDSWNDSFEEEEIKEEIKEEEEKWNYMEDGGQGTSAGGAQDHSKRRKDSLVEMILSEMIPEAEPDPLDFSMLMPLSPAVSPLRNSPSSEDEGQPLTSDDDLNDVVDQLERSMLDNDNRKSRGRKGKGKKSTRGKLKVVESTLGPQGVLEIQESLSDTEQEAEGDLPFTRVGVKTRSNSRTQDDGVFKEPLPVSPFRSRKRRGASISVLDSPLSNTRVTRSSSFPTSVLPPPRVPPIVPVTPIVEKDFKVEPVPSTSEKSNEKLEESTEMQPCKVDKSEKSEKVDNKFDYNKERGRSLRKRKGSLSDSDEDLTISRRSLRSSSTSSDEGSGEEGQRSNRRSPRLGSRSSNVVSPPSRLARSRRPNFNEDSSNINQDNDKKDLKDGERSSEGSNKSDLKSPASKYASKYRGFVKGGVLLPGVNQHSELFNSEKTDVKDSKCSKDIKDDLGVSPRREKDKSKLNSVKSPERDKRKTDDLQSSLKDTTCEKSASLGDITNESSSKHEDIAMKDDTKDSKSKSKVLRRQDSIHSEISSRGSNSMCEADFADTDENDVECDENKTENSSQLDKNNTDANKLDGVAAVDSEITETGTGESIVKAAENTMDADCDNSNNDLSISSDSNVVVKSNKDINGAKPNSIDSDEHLDNVVGENVDTVKDNVKSTSSSKEVCIEEHEQSSDKSETPSISPESCENGVRSEENSSTSDSQKLQDSDIKIATDSQEHYNESKSEDDTPQDKSTLQFAFNDLSNPVPSTSANSNLARSETAIVKGVRCKVVTDSSPAFTRLVNQGSTGFVPICAGDLLSPVTPMSPNAGPPMSLLRPESEDSRAESKSSEGSSEMQGLMNRQSGSMSPRGNASSNTCSAEVKFCSEGPQDEGENGQDRNDNDINEVENEVVEESDNEVDNEMRNESEDEIEDAEIRDDDREDDRDMEDIDEPAHGDDDDDLPLGDSDDDMMGNISDEQSVLSSLPASEAGDEGLDEQLSPVSFLSTSGSSRSLPLSPLPLSDTESLCDPISPLPPTPERQLLRTPTPIDGTRVSPRPSCSNQPCTPPTPNTPPQVQALAKERNPVKLLAIKNLQRQLSSEGHEEQANPGAKAADPGANAANQGAKVVNPGAKVTPAKLGQGRKRKNAKSHSKSQVKGQGKVKAEPVNEVKGRENAQNEVKVELKDPNKETSDLENNNKVDECHTSAVTENGEDIVKTEPLNEQPIGTARGRRISRISTDQNKTTAQMLQQKVIPVVSNKRKSIEKSVAVEEVKPEPLAEIEMPAQVRTFKRRVSRFGKRQMGMEKSESVTSNEDVKVEVKAEAPVVPAVSESMKKKQSTVTSNQGQAKTKEESVSKAVPEKRKPGRPAKRKAEETATSVVKTETDTQQPGEATSSSEGNESPKKPRPSELKAVETELQYLVRLKGMNHKIVADRLVKIGCSSEQLVQHILAILEKNTCDLLKILLVESNKVKDVRLRSSWKPIIADHEEKIVLLILHLGAVMPTLVKDFLVKGGKFIKSNKVVPASVSVSRVIAGLLRQVNDSQRLRVMLYDFLIGSTNGYPSVLVAMVGVWPLPLAKLDRRQAPNIVLDAMEFTVMSKLCGQRVKHNKIVMCLQNLLGWTEVSLSLVGMAQNLISNLMAAENQGYEELLCCRLLLVGQTWEWINNQLILGMMWPHLQSWVGGQTKISDQTLQNLLSLLGEAAAKCPPAFSASIEGLMKTLSALASGLPRIQVSEEVKKTCLKALLELSPFDPLMVAATCANWVRDHHHDYDVNAALQHKIKTFIAFYKTRLQAIDLTVFNL